MPYFNIFGPEFKNNIFIFEIITFEFVENFAKKNKNG